MLHNIILFIGLGPGLGPFWKKKYESSAEKHWHEFYKRNSNNFYKDRHYLHVVFPELAPAVPEEGTGLVPLAKTVSLLEVGCGVGNACIPLLEVNPNVVVHAIDFARSAINILQQHEYHKPSSDGSVDGEQRQQRLFASQCDVVKNPIPVPPNSMDYIMCMFVLSAVAPEVRFVIFCEYHIYYSIKGYFWM